MKYELQFFSKDIDPPSPGEYLILNPCDGFHLADAMFDEDEFEGFYDFANGRFDEDFYVAWAKIPDSWKVEIVAPQK